MIEYTLVMGIIVTIIFAMGPMIRRGLQGMIKVVSDQVGNQEASEQLFDDQGHLESSFTKVDARFVKNIQDQYGRTTYAYGDRIETTSNVYLNLGFTPDNR